MPASGSDNHFAKTTPAAVVEIRQEYDEAISLGQSVSSVIKKLAEQRGMSKTAIYYIGTRKTWRDVPEGNNESDEGSGT